MDPRTYHHLRDVIRRYIERQTEDKMLIFSGLKPTVPASKGKAMPADPNPKKKPKPGGAPAQEEAASVKPGPNPKKHPEDKNKKGKGKGEGKERPRGRRNECRQEEDPV